MGEEMCGANIDKNKKTAFVASEKPKYKSLFAFFSMRGTRRRKWRHGTFVSSTL
jgi:hypothetical protein